MGKGEEDLTVSFKGKGEKEGASVSSWKHFPLACIAYRYNSTI